MSYLGKKATRSGSGLGGKRMAAQPGNGAGKIWTDAAGFSHTFIWRFMQTIVFLHPVKLGAAGLSQEGSRRCPVSRSVLSASLDLDGLASGLR